MNDMAPGGVSTRRQTSERPAQGREIELKFDLEPGSDDALLDHPLIRDRIGSARQTSSTYYDTSKRSLRKAGVSLRVRRTGDDFVQTVKSNAGASVGLFNRAEWEESIAGPDPELDRIADLAPPLGRKALRDRLRPVFTTLIDRRACIVDRGDARIEVVIDQGEVVVGKQRQPLLELELELLDGSPAALFDVARELGSSVPLRLGVLTKSERGERLASGKNARAMKAESVRLTAEMDAAQAFQTIAFSCIRHFRVNEPLVISARDVDALHQSRVALRRLRSSFSLFRPLLTDPALERFKTELRWLSATLGEARNLDVLLRRRSEELSRKSRKALIEVRGIAYDRAIAALRSVSVETATIDLAEWIALGSFGEHGPQGDLPIAPFSATVLDRFWKKVRRCGKDLFDLDDEERHELRIAGKKLRYAGEFFSDLYGGDMLDQRNAFLAEMSALQDHLGALNDMATERTLEERLRALKIVLPDGSEDKSEDDVGENLARAHASVMKLTEITPFWR